MARPAAAGILTMVGGAFIILGGIFFALIGAVFALLGIFSSVFLLGIVVGILTVLVGVLMIAIPAGHTVWGLLAIVLAVASIPFALAGLIVGLFLTFIGGVVSIQWKRSFDRVIDVEARVLPPGT